MGKFSSQHAALGGKKGNFPSKILYFLDKKSPHQKYEIHKLKERSLGKKKEKEKEDEEEVLARRLCLSWLGNQGKGVTCVRGAHGCHKQAC